MKLLESINKYWRSMGIVRKFAAALGSMLALILFVAAVGYIALQVLEQKAGDIVADSMRMQRLALEVDSRLQLARQAQRDFTLRVKDLGVEGARTVYATEFASRLGEAGRNVAWLQDMERFREDKKDSVRSAAQLIDLRQALERYSDHFRHLVEQAAQSGVEDQSFERTLGELDGEYLRLTSLVRQFAISASDAARKAHEGIAQSSGVVTFLLALSVLFALLLATSIIVVLNRTVAKSVVRLRDAATELSLGNFEARAHIDSADEFGQLAGSINGMAERITSLVNNLEGQAAMASDRLMEAIDAISEGFMLFDKHERLVLANRKIREMAGENSIWLTPGMPFEEMADLNARSGLFVSAHGCEEDWVRRKIHLMHNPGPFTEEPLSDGRWLLFKVFRSERGESVIIMSDITARKRRDMDMATVNSDLEALVRDRTQVLVEKATELKQANQRLQELDELKSSFLSSVSHELRTPLTSLLGFSKIIKRDFNRNFIELADDEKTQLLGQRIQTNLDIIGSEGERLTRLINDVLDLSRIESGQEEWHVREVDLAGAINRAVNSASGLFAPKPEVQLIIRRFDMVPAVLADPDRIHQVLINLLSNAAKFTDAGEVAVDLFLDRRDMVHLCVEDSGQGIEPRFIEQIFDKFHQAHRGDTLSQRPGGTGLGLAICRQIVERYNGRIWAESTPGTGTRIHVLLPVADLDDSRTILVVDDDAAAREYLSMVLKKEGYGVRTACDGLQALNMARQHRPSLITMDLNMPGMDGRTAIRLLRKDVNFTDVPILVVSVASDCQSVGADAILLKPVQGDAFVQAVHGLLGDSESSRPVLALGDAPISASDGAFLHGNAVTQCSEPEMWKLLDQGFQGTVVVPGFLADTIDMDRICENSHVQVLLLPDESCIKTEAVPPVS